MLSRSLAARLLVSALLAAVPLGRSAGAQAVGGSVDTSAAPRGTAALIGRVIAAGEGALADAEVTVLGDGARAGTHGTHGDRGARSTDGGAFRVDSLVPGRYFVRVRRMGYEPLFFSATLAAGAARRIDVELTRLPTRLARVEVRASSGYDAYANRRWRNFERRRNSGNGRFFTRDDLRRYDGQRLSDAVRYLTFGASGFHGIGCAGYGSDFGPASYTGGADGLSGYAGSRPMWLGGASSGNTACGISINGSMAMPADASVDFPIREVEAVELYAANTAPMQFGGFWTGPIIVVWTGEESSDP